jgi:hypothetical protein
MARKNTVEKMTVTLILATGHSPIDKSQPKDPFGEERIVSSVWDILKHLSCLRNEQVYLGKKQLDLQVWNVDQNYIWKPSRIGVRRSPERKRLHYITKTLTQTLDISHLLI